MSNRIDRHECATCHSSIPWYFTMCSECIVRMAGEIQRQASIERERAVMIENLLTWLKVAQDEYFHGKPDGPLCQDIAKARKLIGKP